jgi:small subunit ribosomal protein S9
MVMAGKIVHKSGKRKKSVARTTIQQGSGVIRVNSVLLDNYSSKIARYKIRDVLLRASDFIDLNKVDISAVVHGGGVMGQADAISSSIAKGLVEYAGSSELHNAYMKHDRTLIAGDHRETEVHKPSQSSKGPRHKRQKSYR